MTEAVEPEKYSHEQAKLIAARLTFEVIKFLETNEDYFIEHDDRLDAWKRAIDEHFEACERGNYFDAVVVYDRFLMRAFVLDQPVFPGHVIQEFSDIRQGQ